MSFSPLIDQLIQSLRCLPSVGPRTAQRMAFHLLINARGSGLELATRLQHAMQQVHHCKLCRNLSETELCLFCANPGRDHHLLCLVEMPTDVLAIEQTTGYKGLYFVLMGHLSPLDGIGPDNLGIPDLVRRIQQENIREIILATNPTVEGEATAHYISNLVRMHDIKLTRIARGVPLGGELEFVDGGTLSRAFIDRTPMME
ncbi:MAG: recombination mediator RecR [Gammaproteobacteria bacterium]